jgi:excisionase family DNA binding protein
VSGELLTERQVADWLGCGYTTLRRMRQRGDGPAVIVLGSRLIRYRAADVGRWLDDRARRSA